MKPVAASIRPDTVGLSSAPRPTASPGGVPFSTVLRASASAIVRGAETAASFLPGGPVMAVALRSSGAALANAADAGNAVNGASAGLGGTTAPEGPVGTGAGVAAGATVEPSLDGSIAQARDMNLYYLQVQEQVNAENRRFSTLSNVLKAQHETVKTAIGNIR